MEIFNEVSLILQKGRGCPRAASLEDIPRDQKDGVGMEVLGLCAVKPSTKPKFYDKDALESAFS